MPRARKPPPPTEIPSPEVLDYLESVVARLESLGDRLEAYAEQYPDGEPDEEGDTPS